MEPLLNSPHSIVRSAPIVARCCRFHHAVDDKTKQNIVGCEDLVAVRANHVIDIAGKLQLSHVLRVGVEHSQHIAVERTPLQLALRPDVELGHRLLVHEDALPVLAELRRHELKIGLISNGQRDLEEFAQHHVLEVDAVVGSKSHGRIKPHASIFLAALEALGVEASETVMVGDSYEDDIEGARALGIRAILLDRDGLRVEAPDRIDTLLALPAALGLAHA